MQADPLTLPGKADTAVSVRILAGSSSISVQTVGKGRTEPPEIAWGSDIFSRVVHDVIQCSPGPDSYAFSISYGGTVTLTEKECKVG